MRKIRLANGKDPKNRPQLGSPEGSAGLRCSNIRKECFRKSLFGIRSGPMGIAVDRRKLEEIVDGYEQLAGFLCYDHLATLSHLDKYIDTEAGARILEEFLLQKSTKALLV